MLIKIESHHLQYVQYIVQYKLRSDMYEGNILFKCKTEFERNM